MSPRYGVRVDQPGGYSLELTNRGEGIVYRAPDLQAEAQVAWIDENGTLRAHLYAATLQRSDDVDPLPSNVAETLIERMAAFLGDSGKSAVSVDRSPVTSAVDAVTKYIAQAEATGEWKAEQRGDGIWAIRRTRSPKDSK
jgi:hypothetical protein